MFCLYLYGEQFIGSRSAASMLLIKRLRNTALPRLTRELLNTNSLSFRSGYSYHSLEDAITLEINGETLNFPHVWLRDNCQCQQCFHPSAKSRILDWSKFNLNTKPTQVHKDENSVRVTWDDGHTSQYRLDWLKFRSFTKKNQQQYDKELYKPPKVTWKGDDFQKICTTNDYNEIVSSDKALFKWLNDLSTYGVSLIQNTPNDETAIESIIKRVGFPKQTHYGVKFIVQNVANTSNVAYLSSNLQMHTDLPYYGYCPGVNLLHCLVQTKSDGGENTLSDCHYVANYMKEHHPNQYRILTDMEIEWSDIGVENGNEFYKLYRSPVICVDKLENVSRINFSIPQRGSHFPGPIELVRPWYEAHSLFFELNRRFSAKVKVDTGSILTFDNIRLLHGRNQYQDCDNNIRKLIGAYVDWDEVYSRLRSLKVKLEKRDYY
ncbi:gamma-butyrobetaine dioxygenase [Papilio machaon]|uniref:gamma-butyrobetaine dioxygenase n=1 Tax=Papilio machaon TaxID=76193 RepID=UPI001E665D6B|nr:gamma-butyrobetaine dioxygenase [Papilio machaon]